jgi:hypothetical protein
VIWGNTVQRCDKGWGECRKKDSFPTYGKKSFENHATIMSISFSDSQQELHIRHCGGDMHNHPHPSKQSGKAVHSSYRYRQQFVPVFFHLEYLVSIRIVYPGPRFLRNSISYESPDIMFACTGNTPWRIATG